MAGKRWWALGVLAVIGAGLFMAPREPVVTDVQFDAQAFGNGVETYFDTAEADVPNLNPKARKRVVWAAEPETPTNWTVVYVHGFSASAEEVRPLPELVAGALGANLLFTRLRGHGRDSAAMAEATVEGWMTDMAEILSAAGTIGDRVLVMGTSTGATLAVLAAAEQMSDKVDGLVLISPNFQPQNPASALLTWPAARWWVPLIAGRERSWEPHNTAQAENWNTRYPIEAVFPMAATVKAAMALDHADMTIPALMIFDPADQVVDHAVTAKVAERWGAGAEVHQVSVTDNDDPSHHVIAGDILSPAQTAPMADVITTWAKGLPER